MGLSSALARLASRRLHVLVVEHPGAFVTRARTERAVTARGWVLATSPAETDALLECGTARDEPQTAAVEHVWSQVPGPRSRGRLVTVAEIEPTLNALAAGYRAWSAQEARPDPGPERADHHQEPNDEHDEHDESQMEGDDMDDMHDMDGDMHMDMSGPGGIPLASGSDDDRDGLEMDVLHLPLGPVLASWPAGLVVTATLSGDVITGVEVDVTPPDTHTNTGTHTDADAAADLAARAYRLDAAARVLDLTGAQGLSARARSARDQVLDGESPDLADLRRRVGRSRALRRSLRRVGPVSPQQAADHGWPSAWVGDAYDRLVRLTADSSETPSVATGLDTVATVLPDLLVGCELAAARLTVASLVGHRS